MRRIKRAKRRTNANKQRIRDERIWTKTSDDELDDIKLGKRSSKHKNKFDEDIIEYFEMNNFSKQLFSN